jgi:hypothetical protein
MEQKSRRTEVLRKGDKTNMAREAIDRQTLLALVIETIAKFPPQKDSTNLRPFRSISVDYLEGKITHPQFNLLYTKGKTAKEITDGILDLLNARQPRMSLNLGRTEETLPKKWQLPQQCKRSRRFWNGCSDIFPRASLSSGVLPR